MNRLLRKLENSAPWAFVFAPKWCISAQLRFTNFSVSIAFIGYNCLIWIGPLFIRLDVPARYAFGDEVQENYCLLQSSKGWVRMSFRSKSFAIGFYTDDFLTGGWGFFLGQLKFNFQKGSIVPGNPYYRPSEMTPLFCRPRWMRPS